MTAAAGIYLTVSMMLTSLSIILTVFILQLTHSESPRPRRVPSSIRQLFVYRLGPALGVRHPALRPGPRALNQALMLSAWPCLRPRDPEVSPVGGGYLPLAVRQQRSPCDDPISRHLTLCLERHRAKQELEDVITEWRLLTLIFDRLMFWTFLAGTAMATVFILVILPLTKPDM